MASSLEIDQQSLNLTLQDIQQKLIGLEENSRKYHDDLKTEISLLKTHTNDKIDPINKEVLSLKEMFSKQIRARNLILYNLTDNKTTNNKLWETGTEIFKKIELEILDVAIEDIYRLGKKPAKRPVIIKFISSRWVKLAFTKMQSFGENRLFIANDLSREEQDVRRLFSDAFRILKADGLHPEKRGPAIWLNGQRMSREKAEVICH